MWERYGKWLARAVVLDFADSAADRETFRKRLMSALPVTLLINALALLLALSVAIPLAAHVGMRIGGLLDRTASTASFVCYGMPEFLIATLLVLIFGGGFFGDWLPTHWLRSDGVEGQPFGAQLWDLIKHLILPVFTLALAYGVVAFRFLRSSIARAAASDFVVALRGWGTPEHVVRRRVLKNGLSPLVTLLGTMLPSSASWWSPWIERFSAADRISSLS